MRKTSVRSLEVSSSNQLKRDYKVHYQKCMRYKKLRLVTLNKHGTGLNQTLGMKLYISLYKIVYSHRGGARQVEFSLIIWKCTILTCD
jgi:hypothetical protein